MILFLLTGATGSITALADVIFPSETFIIGLSEDFDPSSELLTRLRILHPIVASVLSLYLYSEANRLEKEHRIFSRNIKALVLLGVCLTLVKLFLELEWVQESSKIIFFVWPLFIK